MEYLIDTSALFALVNKEDRAHGEAMRIYNWVRQSRAELILLNFILAETHTLLRIRVGHENARAFLLMALRDYARERITVADEIVACRFLQGNPHPLQLSYFDAVLCAAADRLKIKKIFAFDTHFEQMGLELLKVPHG
jgi:predicted nucleic acid-binding protein